MELNSKLPLLLLESTGKCKKNSLRCLYSRRPQHAQFLVKSVRTTQSKELTMFCQNKARGSYLLKGRIKRLRKCKSAKNEANNKIKRAIVFSELKIQKYHSEDSFSLMQLLAKAKTVDTQLKHSIQKFNSQATAFSTSKNQKWQLYHFVFLKFHYSFKGFIILMDFGNYTYPFFSFPFMYDALCRYPYMNGIPPEPVAPRQVHSSVQSQPQVKVEHVIKKLNKQALTENLKKFHQDEIRYKKTHWTEQQDKLLQKLVQIQKLQWREIPSFFNQRTQNMCYSRYRRISMGTKDRNWTKEQEQNVVDLISRYGERWKFLSSKIPKFTPKQIRQRYLNYLRPNISKQEFSMQQDLKICQYVIKNGKHWRRMEEIVEGRSEGAIKGRYYGKLQKIIESSFEEQIF